MDDRLCHVSQQDRALHVIVGPCHPLPIITSQVADAVAKQPASAAPSLDMRTAVGPTLARQTPVTAEIHWKLMMLHYDGPEHVDAVFRLRGELSHR